MIEKSRAYGPDGSSKMPSFNDSMTVQEGEEFMKRRHFILSMLSTGLAGPLRSTKDSRADTTAVRGLSDMPTVGGDGLPAHLLWAPGAARPVGAPGERRDGA